MRRQILEIEDAVCNRCGETCMSKEGERYGLSAEVAGGYESTHLFDMVTYRFDLCERCLSELFKEFKIPPEREGVYTGLEG